ncbi:MAG: glycosyltransferase [Crocinitomicaceae bacterium]|nr:glycosyltransferase [Crocinitomicaceae bacterium]
MKLLIIGSKSIHLSSFIQALNGQGIRPYFLAEEACDYSEVEKEFVVPFRSKNPSAVLSSNRQLKAILKDLKPDLVHVHQVNRLAYFATRHCDRLNIPCLTTAWGSDVLVIPQQNSFFKFLVKKTLQRSKLITADSQEMIDSMQKIVPSSDRYTLLQYGIDLIDAVEKEKIIYSNRLHKPIYRIDQIIRYFEDIEKDHTDWRLVIGAVGVETDNLKALVIEKGLENRVDFVGWLEKEDNHAWYAKSSIYISIPEHDGTAVSLLEAMSAGCVPIVPDLVVSKEWITDGINGVIEKSPNNPIRRALEIDASVCAKTNRKLVEEKAGRTNCTKQFIELYNRVKS